MASRRYDAEHRALREWWRPFVERGEVQCHAVVCLFGDRTIYPGQLWHMGHNAAGDQHTGPEHMSCNCHDGGVRGNASRWDTEVPASIDW